MLVILLIVVGLALISLGLAALFLRDRRRRLQRATEVLGQLEEERRARRSAERRLAQLQKELAAKTRQLEQEAKEQDRSGAVAQVHAAVKSLPLGAGPIAVVSHGDDELVHLEGHIGWHFPQTDEGVYAGYHPADSDAAIHHLEDLRRRGARYLLIPETSSWWLTHYVGFRDYLTTNYRLTEPGDGIAALVELSPSGTAKDGDGA